MRERERERERERTRVLLPWAWRTWGGSEKRGARVFRVWLWLDLYTNSEEENGKKLKGDFVNSRKKRSMGLYAWQQGYNTECGPMKPVIVVPRPNNLQGARNNLLACWRFDKGPFIQQASTYLLDEWVLSS